MAEPSGRRASAGRGRLVLDLAGLGVSRLAYARPALANGQKMVSIHAADGALLGLAPSAAAASEAIELQDLIEIALH